MSNSKNSLARCWLTIERNSPRLFVSDSNSCRVEIWDVAPESDSQVERTDFCNGTTQVNKRFVSTVAEMDNALKMARSPASARMAIIHRANSWSRMKITVEMFKLLCVASQMDASFMALVLGMGKKSQPQDEHFMGSYARLYNIPQPRPCLENEDGQAMNGLVFVLGYKIRYLERHGRDLKDPWSCRQSVVHQSYSFEHNVTNLVVIHPSQKFNELIEDLKMEFDVHPLNFHLRYIVAATQTWREYLDAIHLDLLSLDQKVSFPKRFQEFDLDFSVSQHLQWTRRKLYQAETILRGTQAILRTVRDHEKKLCGLGLISSSVRLGFLCEMENINREIGSHCNTVHELIKLSDDMKSMISDILNFRNQELLVTNGLHLSKIADMNHTDSETLINMAATSSRDSKTTRIATMIAMLYLPASLVLSFFSTGFVEFHSGGQSGLSVNRDIWIPVVSIVVLGLTTLLGFWAWLRRGTISHGHFKNP